MRDVFRYGYLLGGGFVAAVLFALGPLTFLLLLPPVPRSNTMLLAATSLVLFWSLAVYVVCVLIVQGRRLLKRGR